MGKTKADNDLEKLKRIVVPSLRRNGVTRAGIFGSFARGETKKGSDIDILIEFKGRKSLLDLVRVERELKERTGRDVDIVEYSTIHPRLKDRILEEEVRIL